MKTYQLNNEDESLVLLNEENFEKINLCECNGGKRYCHNSGCYIHSNTEGCWNEDCFRHLTAQLSDEDIESIKSFRKDNSIDCYDFIEIFINESDIHYHEIKLKNYLSDELIKIVESNINDYMKNETHVECYAFNYWDGSNRRTLLLKNDINIDNDIAEADDELNEKILSEYDSVEWGEWSFSARLGETENFTFHQSRFASNPYIAEVYYK